ncbi:MAG: endolytic transglycosylase MltG [Pseudomonadota bacterium]
MLRRVFCIFLFVFLSTAVGLFFVAQEQAKVLKSGVFYFEKGSNINDVSLNLEHNGFVSVGRVFEIYAKIWLRLNDECQKRMQYGEYSVLENDGFSKVLRKICNGDVVMHQLTIPEGLEVREVVELLRKNEFLVGDVDVEDVKEGYLLPETYSFARGALRSDVLKKMKDSLQIVLDVAWNERDVSIPLKSKEELLILASIVEKEARVAKERPIIASVYLNRLEKGMRLQADPTSMYEITRGRFKMERALLLKDLQIAGDYNTYKIAGLPKTPIANAGRDVIFATAKPAKTDYLFFVANGVDGGHIFSSNYKEHLENIKKYKANLQMNTNLVLENGK